MIGVVYTRFLIALGTALVSTVLGERCWKTYSWWVNEVEEGVRPPRFDFDKCFTVQFCRFCAGILDLQENMISWLCWLSLSLSLSHWGVVKKRGWKRRIAAFGDVWLSSGSRRSPLLRRYWSRRAWALTFLVMSSLRVKAKRPQKRQSFCSFVLFFLLLSNLLTVFVKRNVQN